MVRKSKSVNTPLSVKSLTKLGNTILANRYVLYGVALLALMNLVSYMMMADYGSLVFFILSGLLATYFTKNMIVTLLVAILLTNVVYRALRSNGMLRRLEGFDNNDKKDNKDKSDKASEPKPATEEEEGEDEVDDAARVDNQKTMQEAYKHLDKLMGKGGIEGLSKEAKSLAQEQMKLMETMESMKPVMDTMLKTVDNFGGMENLLGMASKIGGSSFK